MHKVCGLVLLLLCTYVQPVVAADALLSDEYKQCMDEADSTGAMSLCIVEETKKQDLRLNAAYQQLMHKLPLQQQQLLRESQIIWLTFRSAYSDFLYLYEEEKTSRLVSGYWYMYNTAEQARQLEFLLGPLLAVETE